MMSVSLPQCSMPSSSLFLKEESVSCMRDKGYDGEPVREQIRIRGYTPRVARKKRRRGRPPKNRRWVVEAAHSWFNRFRKLLVRYEKLSESYEALLHLAAAIICWRKVASYLRISP